MGIDHAHERTRAIRKFAPVVLTVVLVATLSSCSSGGSDGTASTTSERTASSTEAQSGTTTTSSTTPPVGSTEVGGSAAQYARSLARGLTAAKPGQGELLVTAEEGACAAPRWISVMTVDRLVAKKVSPADLENPDFGFPSLGLTSAQGTSMVDAFVDCHVNIFEQFSDVLAEGLNPTQTSCLKSRLTDALARTFLSEALTSTDISADLSTTLDSIDKACKLSAG